MGTNGIKTTRQFVGRALEAYLLPTTSWDEVFALQQRLVYEISGDPDRRAALILCEHPSIITVGRQGSRRHVRRDDEESDVRELPLKWTNRGGGCWLHLPGQLLAYPILPLRSEKFFLGLDDFRSLFYQTILEVLGEIGVLGAERDLAATGVRVNKREIASVGVAIKNWVTYHGAWLNVCPQLDEFEGIQQNPNDPRKVTSMFREMRLPIRITSVRESFLRNFVEVFGFKSSFLCQPPRVPTPAASRLRIAG